MLPLVGAALIVAAALMACAAALRSRVARGEPLPVPVECARVLMCSARRVLRLLTCGAALDRAADLRRLEQDRRLAEVGGPVAWCFYGGAEFATWADLEDDLVSHATLLPPVRGALNAGLDGASVADLRRHAFALVQRHRPRGVVLSIGDGDYESGCMDDPPDAATRCARDAVRLVDDLYECGVRDVRVLLTPDPPGASERRCDFGRRLADRLMLLCRRFDTTIWWGLTLAPIDLRKPLGHELGRLGDAAYLADGLVPAATAHQLKGDLLRGVLG
jgi:hypothetical protein